jgi:hypothetical protein
MDLDLRPGVTDKFPERGYEVTSAPAIYKNLVITGAAASDREPRRPTETFAPWTSDRATRVDVSCGAE